MMAKYKKAFPLIVLQTIEELLKKESPYFETTEPGNSLLKFRDKDPRSDFFFELRNYKLDTSQKLMIEISYKPRQKNFPHAHSRTIEVAKLSNVLKDWIDILEEYERIKIFDDPILKQYEEEFLTDFDLLDDDADTKSYDFKTQVLIEQYLTYCENRLSERKTEENKDEIEKIEQEISDLKVSQTQLTKRKVVQKLARIWAKTRKFGLDLIKDIYQEAKKEVIKQLVKGGIDLI